MKVDLDITEFAAGGDAVGIVLHGGERRAVFLRGAIPGERVSADVDFRERPARGRLLAVVSSAPDRVPPACEHAMRCGGCDWMHLSIDAQSRVHRERLANALPPAWRGSFDVTNIRLTRPTGIEGYRSRARLHLKANGKRAIVGFHRARSHEPIEIDRCIVLRPELEKARLSLAAIFEGAKGRGDLQLASGSATSSGEPRRAVLSVHFHGDLPPPVFGRLERAVADGLLAGTHLLLDEATRPTVIGDPTPWTAGGDGRPLRLAPGGFAQASEEGNVALAQRVAAWAEAAEPIVELYAGAGNFTVLLARGPKKVTAVESQPEACTAAERNLRERGLSARVVEGDAAAFAWPKGTRLVVLDPPRTGARAVAERLVASPVARVIYVSCDLATLERDLAILAPAYELRAVEGLELFPQTSHLESLVLLERRRP